MRWQNTSFNFAEGLAFVVRCQHECWWLHGRPPMRHNVTQIAVVADLRSEKLSAETKQRYENNFQNQEGAGNKGNLLLQAVVLSSATST